MKSLVVKRSIIVRGHKTSVSLEDAFWQGLKEIALSQRITLSNMVAEIDARRQHSNLSSSIRIFVLERLRIPALNCSMQTGDRPGMDGTDQVSRTLEVGSAG
ncbi:MAG TPA: ribbon-helix-helix domain-containing protein [Pseudolabrys sp.]|jgi:predicted DNA-binding ribbon-helix-helix protein|nr:ribbon-helix-helix domain-containing protein [Pseudolabrys sp.]